jgi:DNA-damage-inducible protein D
MSDIKLFESKSVRSHWDAEQEQWYFSVIDVVEILTNSSNPRDYWFKMKIRIKTEDGLELSTICRQLKLKAADGKMRETDVADTQTLLRLIQSIPSPKAEPFKQWLAKVGYERMQEIADPSQGIDRARENWQKLGRSEKWIQQRMTGQETRNKLTDYWKESGVEKTDEFALLTNIIHQEWTGLKVKDHKTIKGLTSQNLRDHMSEAELIFTALAELSTRQIALSDQATGLQENAKAGKKGGKIAKDARLSLEAQTGQKVVSDQSFLQPRPTNKELK